MANYNGSARGGGTPHLCLGVSREPASAHWLELEYRGPVTGSGSGSWLVMETLSTMITIGPDAVTVLVTTTTLHTG